MIHRIVTQLLLLSLFTMNIAWAVDKCAITQEGVGSVWLALLYYFRSHGFSFFQEP